MTCIDTAGKIGKFRIGVGAMILNNDKKVFVGYRKINKTLKTSKRCTLLQMPQGGIDPGENPANAIMREIYEETGIVNAKIIYESKYWYSYLFPPHLRGRLWNGARYDGQRQKWFLLQFLGTDDEVNCAIAGHEHQEFSAWQWIEVSQLRHVAVDFRKKLYKAVVEEFLPIIREL